MNVSRIAYSPKTALTTLEKYLSMVKRDADIKPVLGMKCTLSEGPVGTKIVKLVDNIDGIVRQVEMNGDVVEISSGSISGELLKENNLTKKEINHKAFDIINTCATLIRSELGLQAAEKLK